MRAIAVLGVVLFHAGFSRLSGGYVGVDVFFVISGYLISRNILARKSAGNFSFSEFFKRRILRLFPALFVTVLVTLIAGYFILTPAQLVETSYSASAAVTAFANFFFWSQTGYWDSDILSKPLIHTWTLSVEEQFYLLWPLLLAVLSRFRSIALFSVIAALGFLSLLASIWLTPKYPQAAFYLMPFRIFEFVIGALCVGLDKRGWPESSASLFARTILFIGGLAAILFAYLKFDDNTLTPGSAILIPTLGTGAVILARNPPIFGAMISNRLFVFIGLLSYSIYLVHWPVLSFLSQLIGEFSQAGRFVALAGIFVLSLALYFGVEKPARYGQFAKKAAGNRSQIFALAFAAMLAIAVLAQIATFNKGFPNRYKSDLAEYAALTREDAFRARLENYKLLCKEKSGIFCGQFRTDKSNILIIGDSHGPDGYNAMLAAVPTANYLVYISEGCPPLENVDKLFFLENREKCRRQNVELYETINTQFDQIELLVISTRIDRPRIARIAETTHKFESQNLDVFVFGPGPVFHENLHQIILRHPDPDELAIATKTATDRSLIGLDALLEEEVTAAGGDYLSRKAYFCPEESCAAFIPGTNIPTMFDGHHISDKAARAFGEYSRLKISKLFEKLGIIYD